MLPYTAKGSPQLKKFQFMAESSLFSKFQTFPSPISLESQTSPILSIETVFNLYSNMLN